MAASVFFQFIIILCQTSEGLKCYCEGRHCKGADANGTCIEDPGGVCFGALAKVYDDDPNVWKYESFYGCYTGGPEKLAMCERNEIPGMKCCKDRDYCNWQIVPRLPDHLTTPRPEEKDKHLLYTYVVVYVSAFASVLLILICALCLYYYLKKRRQDIRIEEEPAVAMSDLTAANPD